MKPIAAAVRTPAVAAGAVGLGGLVGVAPVPAGAAVAANEGAATLVAEPPLEGGVAEPPLEGGVEESEAAPWPSGSEEAAFLAGAPEGAAAVVLAAPVAESNPTEKLAPLPPLEELIQRVPPAVREALDDLFRAKFTSVRRV